MKRELGPAKELKDGDENRQIDENSKDARTVGNRLTPDNLGVIPGSFASEDFLSRFGGDERRSDERRQSLSGFGEKRRRAEDKRRNPAAPIVQNHILVHQIRDH